MGAAMSLQRGVPCDPGPEGKEQEQSLIWVVVKKRGPFLGTLNNRYRIILGTQNGTIILITTHLLVGLCPHRPPFGSMILPVLLDSWVSQPSISGVHFLQNAKLRSSRPLLYCGPLISNFPASMRDPSMKTGRNMRALCV